MGTKNIVLIVRLMKHLELTELVCRAAIEQMRRQIAMAVKKQKPGQPAPTHPRENEASQKYFTGLTDTHDSHNSYSISTGNATCPVFFIRMDKSVFRSAAIANTRLLSFLDFHIHNASTSSS